MKKDRKTPSAVEYAVESILERIRLGEFVGGQRLIEADLVNELGVGRGPLRDALRVLSGDGVIELIPNKGARVRKLEETDLVEMLQVLTALNWIALRICAEKSDKQQIRETVRSAYERLERASNARDEASWYLAIGRFHEELHEASGNRLLLREYSRLRLVHFHRELARALKVRNWDHYLGTYESITSAVMEGRADDAAQLVSDHGNNMIDLINGDQVPAVY